MLGKVLDRRRQGEEGCFGPEIACFTFQMKFHMGMEPSSSEACSGLEISHEYRVSQKNVT